MRASQQLLLTPLGWMVNEYRYGSQGSLYAPYAEAIIARLNQKFMEFEMREKSRVETSSGQAAENELGMVELAAILVRRRWVFCVAFGLVFALGVVFAVTKGDAYRYTSIYRLAEINSERLLEAPATLMAKVTNVYLPAELTTYKNRLGLERVPFGIKASHPEKTALISLETTTAESNAEVLAEMHGAIMDRMVSGQNKLLDLKRAEIKGELKGVNSTIEQLKDENSSAVALSAALARKAGLESQLATLNPGERLAEAQRSLEREGFSRKLIVVLAAFSAFVLAACVTFFAEFASRVRQSLK